MPKIVTEEELWDRFDRHQKMSRLQLERLFPTIDIDRNMFRFLEKGYRHVTIIDIETISFDARMGFMICWCGLRWDIVTGKTKLVYDQLEPEDMKGKYKEKTHNFDERLLQSLSAEIKRADMIVGHYISKFDIPFFKTRCHMTKQHNLVPDYNETKMMDTWKIMKSKYNAYNSGGNSLRNAGYIFNGHDDKTSVDLDKWKAIYYVKRTDWKRSRKFILDHCKIDVKQNYEVFLKQCKQVPIGGTSV